ncbi:Type-1 restriction enzyme EcoKI specificity protein [compost metagenome]
MTPSKSKLGDYVLPVKNGNPVVLFGDSDFVYLDISSIDRELRAITTPQVILASDAPSRARQITAENDVVVSTVRPKLNTVAVVTDEHAGAIASTGFCVLRPVPGKLDARFLFHWISSEATISQLVALATGATYPAVSDKIIKSLPFVPPSFFEQQRIASILDKADSLRRKRREAIRLVEEFLRAVFIDMFGDPETNPKSFAKGTIRNLVSSANYGTSEKASEQMGQYPILRMNNITYGGGWNFSSMKYVDLDEVSAHKYLTQKGDLLFNRTNSKELVGKTAVYMRDEPMAIAGYLVRVRMNERGNAHYVSGYLNSAHGKHTLEARAKSIVGMANINAQEMQDIPLLLPPIELQNKFASIVGAMQARLKKHHLFSCEVESLYAALSENFFSQTGERVTELC